MSRVVKMCWTDVGSSLRWSGRLVLRMFFGWTYRSKFWRQNLWCPFSWLHNQLRQHIVLIEMHRLRSYQQMLCRVETNSLASTKAPQVPTRVDEVDCVYQSCSTHQSISQQFRDEVQNVAWCFHTRLAILRCKAVQASKIPNPKTQETHKLQSNDNDIRWVQQCNAKEWDFKMWTHLSCDGSTCIPLSKFHAPHIPTRDESQGSTSP